MATTPPNHVILVDFDIVIPHKRHPDQGTSCQCERKHLRQPKSHALEHELLGEKMTKRYDVGPVCNVIHGA